ncbi:MAG: hypothetical protein HQL87_16745 [Magnetococcales bacterium]|nr:hypothetical protein [Magnetococcales bacterium]
MSITKKSNRQHLHGTDILHTNRLLGSLICLPQHVAKECSLFNGIIKSNMSVRQVIEPAGGHVPLPLSLKVVLSNPIA